MFASTTPSAATAAPSLHPSALARPISSLGALQVRLAASQAEVRAAQAVRHQVFFEERGLPGMTGGLDADRFDDFCDHLIVVDTSATAHCGVVGAYRLLRQDRARLAGGFYSESEFELSRLIARHPGLRFLELGRSCVLPAYRSRRVIELLWQGIHDYLSAHEIDVLVGCASFPGIVPAAHAPALSLLAQNFSAANEWALRPVEGRRHEMDLVPAEAIDARTVMAEMPPLVKAYIRAGARVGDGCVIDHECSTVDVFIMVQVREIASRYMNYYGGAKLAA